MLYDMLHLRSSLDTLHYQAIKLHITKLMMSGKMDMRRADEWASASPCAVVNDRPSSAVNKVRRLVSSAHVDGRTDENAKTPLKMICNDFFWLLK